MKKLVLFLMLVSALVACAPSAPAQPSASAPGVPKGKLVLLLSESPEGMVGYQGIIDAFAQAHPDIQVMINNASDEDLFLERLTADFAAQTPPDIFITDYPLFAQFAVKGALQPLDDYIAKSQDIHPSNYYPAAMDAFKFKGKQYCIPENLSSLEVYYNKKLFTAANLPFPKAGWTWDEFLRDARALTKGNQQYGAGIDPESIRLMPFLWAHGAEFVDNSDLPTKLTLDSPTALEAFQWFVNLQVKEHVVPSRADEATEDSQSRFEHGTMGMYFMSRVATPDLRATIRDFDWDVAPMPADKSTVTILHSDGYCIPSAGKNKDAAWAFVEFANNMAGQQIIAKTGRTVPSLRSVAQSPLFLNAEVPPASSQIYLDMASNMRAVPTMTTWGEIEDTVNKEIERAFYGDISVNEAARTAVSETQEYFKQNQTDMK